MKNTVTTAINGKALQEMILANKQKTMTSKKQFEAAGMNKAHFEQWTTAMAECRDACFDVRNEAGDKWGGENNGVDMTPAFDKIRPILKMLGDVNGAELKADSTVGMILGENARKLVKVPVSDRFVKLLDDIAEVDFQVKMHDETGEEMRAFEYDGQQYGTKEEKLALLEVLKAERDKLNRDTSEDHTVVTPDKVSDSVFRKCFEVVLYERIADNYSRTAEENRQRAKADKDKRREKTAKNNKRKEQERRAAEQRAAEAQKNAENK